MTEPSQLKGQKTNDYAERLLREWPAEKILKVNLESLRERDPELASAIENVAVPETVEMAVARDGGVSFRLSNKEGGRDWLGFSSVPRITAQSNLRRAKLGNANVGMNGIGSGADVEAILGAMAPYQALIVTEADILKLHLVLRLYDLSRYLSRGQLVLLQGPEPENLLEEFFSRHPGYNAVSEAICWTWLSEAENQKFGQQVGLAMDRAVGKTSKYVNELLEQLNRYDQETDAEDVKSVMHSSEKSALRVINCTNAYTLTDYITSRDILGGFAQMGAQTDWLVLDRPEKVSHHAQLKRLNRCKPHLILLVDMLRRDVGTNLPRSSVCATILRDMPSSFTDAKFRPAERLGTLDFVFYPRRGDCEKLSQAELPEKQLVHLPWAANEELFRPVSLDEQEQKQYGAEVVLVAERASTDPDNYKITLPTHQQLLNTVLEDIRQKPENYHREAAGKFLMRAQRCGVKLKEEDLRKYFTGLIENYLGPGAWRDVYCQAVERCGFDFRIWSWATLRESSGEGSSYWQESPVGSKVAGAIRDGEELNKLYNGGKIFICLSDTGYPSDYLLNGIAAGGFFLVKSHPREREQDGIGEFFQVNKELITFKEPQDLVRKIRYYLEHESERRCLAEAARNKLLSRHTYRHRAQSIIDTIVSNRA